MKIRVNPCYDKKTHTDCSRRHVGCATTCKEWAEYQAERDADYVENQKQSEYRAWHEKSVQKCLRMSKKKYRPRWKGRK